MTPIVVAAIAAAFDLVCVGTTQKITRGYRGEDNYPFSTSLRIDLVRKTWCDGSCEAPLPIAKVDPEVIVLWDMDDYISEMTHVVHSQYVNRVSGEYVSSDSMTSVTGELLSAKNVRATCTVKPFSGFPRPAPPPKTKF